MSKASKMSGIIVKPFISTTSETLTRSSAGRTFFLNNSAGLTLTLPAPAKGLQLEFIVETAPTTGDYVIQATGALIKGQVYVTNVTNPSDPNFTTAGVTNIKFKKNVSKVGSSVELECDGTYFYARGFANGFDEILLVEQSKSPSVSPSASPS